MEYHCARRGFYGMSRFIKNFCKLKQSSRLDLVKNKRMYSTMELGSKKSTPEKLKAQKYNILKYDRNRRDYVVEQMSLDMIFPKNRSVYFISNYPSLPPSEVYQNEDHAFTYESADENKVKVSLEDSYLNIPSNIKKGGSNESLYNANLISLQKEFKFDNIVSVSPLSITNLRKYAKRNEIRDMHWFLLPLEEDTAKTRLFNVPNKILRKTCIEVISSLPFSKDSLNPIPTTEANISDDFEALIKSAEILNLKVEPNSISHFKIILWLLFAFSILGCASFVNLNLLMLAHSNL
ncbi:unnamed protein product [Moneuplotes crassus]|uniref:Uncharacterized protein n=1 Tax=Euplotes crassus TaxID=5936 RepID=A0AAD1XKZ5_EUPCR|nr:unnamed protein product [Moneuplotes crassus]